MRGMNDLYDWYQLARKKDLGQKKIAWLQYFQDQICSDSSTSSSQDSDLHDVGKEQDHVTNGRCELTSQCEVLEKDFKKEYSSDSNRNEAITPLLPDTPQHKKKLPYSNFYDESFVSPPPLITNDLGDDITSEKSLSCGSPSVYSPTAPMLDIFSPENNGNKTEDIIRSLGATLDESSVTWTSDLATPSSHSSSKGKKSLSTPSTVERHTLHPSYGLRQKVLARSLFSPLTTGNQSSDNEWSPNLGIIKCHSPVRAFSVKGRYNKDDLRDVNLQRCQDGGTKDLTFIDHEKHGYNRDINGSSKDKVVCGVSRDYSRCKSSTPLSKPQYVIKAVSDPEESANMSQSNTSDTEVGLAVQMMEGNDLSDIADCSGKERENPFDIICSPVKKKPKLNINRNEECHTKPRCTSEIDESNNIVSKSTLCGDVKRTNQLQSCRQQHINQEIIADSNAELNKDSPHLFSQNYSGTKKRPFKDANVEEGSLYSVSDGRNSAMNCVTRNGNKVKKGADCVSCDRSDMQVTPLFRKQHLKEDKISDRPFQMNCSEVNDVNKSILPLPDKPKNLRNKHTLFSKRKKSLGPFLYPTKSEEAYEELGIAFKKNMTPDKSCIYEDNIDALAGIFQVDIPEYKDDVLACSDSTKRKAPEDVQLKSNGHCNSNKLVKHLDSSKMCFDKEVTNKGISTSDGVRIDGNRLVAASQNKDTGTSEAFESHGTTLLSCIEDEKCNVISQFWNDSLNEADIAELEQKLNLQSKDCHGDDASDSKGLRKPIKPIVAFPLMHSNVKNPFVAMCSSEGEVTKNSYVNEVSPKPCRFQAFSTASGTKIKVKESSLKKVQSLWEENLINEYLPSHPNSPGRSSDSAEPLHPVTSVSGSKTNICEESLRLQSKKNKECLDMDDGDVTDQNDNFNKTSTNILEDKTLAGVSGNGPIEKNSSTFGGFTTASGSKIKVKDESLLKQSKLFQEIFDKNAVIFDAQGASAVNCQNSHMSNDDHKCPKYVGSITESPFQGFTTAGGSKIEPSKESLVLQSKKFQEFFVNEEVDPMDKGVKLNNKLGIVEERNTVDITNLGFIGEKSTSFHGFTKASGSKIKISEDSIIKKSKTFEEIFNKEEIEFAMEGDGFISLEGNDEIDKEGHVCAENLDSTSKFPEHFNGFATAAGTKIKLDEKSLLLQSRKFQELFENDVYNSGKQEATYDNIIKNIEARRNPIDISNPIKKGCFQGFTTASGSKVRVSEESLSKSRKLLDLVKDEVALLPQGGEIADGENGINKENLKSVEHTGSCLPDLSEQFKGFFTAAGSKIELEEDSLVLHSKRFQDLFGKDESCSIEQDITPDPKIITTLEDKKHADLEYCSVKKEPFHGFTTASGSKVKVSKESLLKSKKLLELLDKDEVGLSAQGNSSGNNETSSKLNNHNLKFDEKIFSTSNILEMQGFPTVAGSEIRFSSKKDTDGKNTALGYDAGNIRDVGEGGHYTDLVDSGSICKTSKEHHDNTSASRSNVSLCKGSMKNYKTLKKPPDEDYKQDMCQGFTVASGSKITTNEKSLLTQPVKSRVILDNDNNYNREGGHIVGNIKSDINDLELQQSIHFKKDRQSSLGFTSASGSEIKVSEKQLSIYSKKFQEMFKNDEARCSANDKIENNRNMNAEENLEFTKNMNESSSYGLTSSKPLVANRIGNANISSGACSNLAIEKNLQVKSVPVKESIKVRSNSHLVEEFQSGSAVSMDGLCNTVVLCHGNGNVIGQVENTVQDVSCEKKILGMDRSDDKMGLIDENLTSENCDNDNMERSISPIIGSQSVHVERKKKLARFKKKNKRSLKTSKLFGDEVSGNLGNANIEGLQSSSISTTVICEDRSKDDHSQEKYSTQSHECVNRGQHKCHSQDHVKAKNLFDTSHGKTTSLPSCKNKNNEFHQGTHTIKGKPLTSDTQEISQITEAFLKDDSWESENTSHKKRKAQNEKDDGNPEKVLKHQDDRQHIETNPNYQTEDESLSKEKELFCVKQKRQIQEKKEHSIHPVQGILHKHRSENKHQRLSMKSFGIPVSWKDCSEDALGVTARNASFFRFTVVDKRAAFVSCGEGCYIIPGPDDCIGCSEIEQGFLAMPGVSPKLLPSGWVSNHYKWIVWKLAAMERCLIKRKYLTLENLVTRLKYRYDREIDRAERPVIRKITEGDDIPQKTMVLCIAEIKSDQVKDKSACNPSVSPLKSSGVPFLTLTDGWYSIGALVDNAMLQLYDKGRISVGTKLVIHGAELAGLVSPCHPLEAPPGLSLRLHTNMVRRARWWSRLGLISHPRCLPAQLISVFSDGGVIGCLTVVLSRVYPLIYFERSGGISCFRGEKAHLKLVKENQQSKETTLHQIVAEVEKEFEKEEGSLKTRNQNRISVIGEEVCDLRRGREIAQLLENAVDESCIKGLLTASQIDIARSWHQEQAEKRRSKINAEVHRRLSKKQKLYEAVPVLKLRVMDTNGSCAILSVWRPPEELQQTLSEGRVFRIFYAGAAGYRRDCLQLTATRQTRWEEVGSETGHSFPDCNRHVTPLCLTLSKNLHPVWNEVDVVGVVFRIDQMDQGSQLIYIVDHHLNILSLKFWGGLKECGVEDVVSCETMLSVSNCSWRGYSGGRSACVHVTELSVVSISPRHSHLVEAFDHLKKSIEDVKALIHKADMKLDGFKDESSLHTDGGIIRNNCPQTEENMSNDVDSPVVKSFNQTALTTSNINRRAERSREIRSKLSSLIQYGSPSPLTGVTFNNPSPKTWKPFKVPFKNSKS